MKNSLSLLPDLPIAFNRDFVKIGAGVTGALLLSQFIYWSKRTNDPQYYFYKTQAELEDETGLTRREQETARKRLRSLGILEEKKAGVPAKLYYKVNVKKLIELLQNNNTIPKTSTSSKENLTPKETKPNKQESLLNFLENLDLEGVNLEALNEWLEYKNYSYQEIGLQKIVDMLKGFDEDEQRQMIDKSIMNGWQGLFAPKNQNKGVSKQQQIQHSTQERLMIYKQTLEKTDNKQIAYLEASAGLSYAQESEFKLLCEDFYYEVQMAQLEARREI